MPIIENVGGVLRTHSAEFENVGGVIREKQSVVVNDGGVMRTVFSSGTRIGDLNVGDIVQIKEDGIAVNYIIVHKGNPNSYFYDSSCNGVWVLREKAADIQKWSGSSKIYYDQSSIHNWLNSTFISRIDSLVRDEIKTVKIPYVQNSFCDINRLSCKAFLLGANEVGVYADEDGGGPPGDGTKLAYFLEGESTDANKKRNINTSWWLRTPSPNGATNIFCVYYDGKVTVINNYGNTVGTRPAFILPHDFKI